MFVFVSNSTEPSRGVERLFESALVVLVAWTTFFGGALALLLVRAVTLDGEDPTPTLAWFVLGIFPIDAASLFVVYLLNRSFIRQSRGQAACYSALDGSSEVLPSRPPIPSSGSGKVPEDHPLQGFDL